MYQKEELRSDFRKKCLLGWGFNMNTRKGVLSWDALSRMQGCYSEFILVFNLLKKLTPSKIDKNIKKKKSFLGIFEAIKKK